jgi:TRAP-type mannitol/chloroaromatic compound transport system substrate-binding protein
MSTGSSPANGRTLYQEMYDDARQNVHVISCAFGGAETSGWFAKEVRKPEDNQGPAHARLRACRQSDVTAWRHHRAGALGNAFDKHEIDAAAFLTPAVDQRQRVQDHVKFNHMPGWH